MQRDYRIQAALDADWIEHRNTQTDDELEEYARFASRLVSGDRKEIVGNLGGGEVVIHRPDGTIRDSDTVPPGNDPNPPKDTRH